ncbi:phytoene/squalene synthase family protein [Luteolibacter yonseiensis]|uniref:squalene/phytoene synthase family protein n=1 Tax=Luteolibacter yonseiensis TaxID=1144680 RepID=UPI002D7FD473|nr:squalene/phytoene synthase family protein [Luteolibacter yonseiensis]
MTDELGKQVLKGVSRSFYLSLRLLPGPMREAASLGYLLARTSDTLADTVTAPLELRVSCMDQFRRAVAEKTDAPRWPVTLLNAIPDPRERHLLECGGEIFQWLENLSEPEGDLVREVLATIISGQRLDMERFSRATGEHPVALADESALEDYTWRVAGCVGAFWTKLGFLTMGDRFSSTPANELLERGIRYGKALQLVNILRDVTEDLSHGRCYLPVGNPFDRVEVLEAHRRWLETAELWIGEGERYAESLHLRRLRAATILPALIARKTLPALREATWEALQGRIKIPRHGIYRSVIQAFLLPHVETDLQR